MTPIIRPVYDPVKAGALGITKSAMMESVKSINDGLTVGVYRDNEKRSPVQLKPQVLISQMQDWGDFSLYGTGRIPPHYHKSPKILRWLGMATDAYL